MVIYGVEMGTSINRQIANETGALIHRKFPFESGITNLVLSVFLLLGNVGFGEFVIPDSNEFPHTPRVFSSCFPQVLCCPLPSPKGAQGAEPCFPVPKMRP